MTNGTDSDVAASGFVSSRPGCLVWLAAVVACICLGPLTEGAGAQTAALEGRIQDRNQVDCKILYVGFVGGLETPSNRHSGIVQIRDALLGPSYTGVCARTFSPYHWTSGRRWSLKHFPPHQGPMTDDELKQAPKLVLVGHSLGGWAVLSVARGLEREGIPVELTIQVDSVGVTDRTVPRNVKAAAIFYARDILMLMTTKKIKVEDASETTLVANIRVKGVGHESITRDARIREMVLRTVDSLKLSPALADVRPIELSRQYDDDSAGPVVCSWALQRRPCQQPVQITRCVRSDGGRHIYASVGLSGTWEEATGAICAQRPENLLVGIAVGEPSTEVVATSLPEESKTDAPFK